jgi:hypothetical protein
VSVISHAELSPGLESCGAEWPMIEGNGRFDQAPILVRGSAFLFLG